MFSSASRPAAQAATSRDEEIARRASLCWFPGPSVVRFGAAGYVPNRSRARVALCAVASSGLRPSRGSLIGCDS